MEGEQKGMVIWVTGLSGAGKTMLCNALWGLLKIHKPELVILDGDAVRAAFGNDLGYREENRITQIKRLQGMAKILADQGLIVVVAALYAHPELLAWNRENLFDYFEVYLEVSLEALRLRDSKGLYAGAADGEIKNVVGVDIPWHAPIASDLIINTNHPKRPERLAEQVIAAIPRLRKVTEAA
ncbi:MAG: adenylyl-sulfate kinase [Deltaproteobacteria bacterium]|nr:adenylyl-sulfate kinase [Deltaproteobacteria bacterium]